MEVVFLPTCRIKFYNAAMSYYRTAFTSFEEFQREALRSDRDELGKEELELIYDLEDSDNLLRPAARARRRRSRE